MQRITTNDRTSYFRDFAHYKALAEEKFKWPKASDELVQLTGEQMNWLLDGYDISLLKGHNKGLSFNTKK